MPDGISFRFLADPFYKMIDDRQKGVRRASMWALRQAGREVKAASRLRTPVLADKTAPTVAQHRKAGKAGRETSGPVRGLLKASITPSRLLVGDSRVGWQLKVGPRGERVHLYAQKIEARAHYMAAGHAAADAQLARLMREAVGRVWR